MAALILLPPAARHIAYAQCKLYSTLYSGGNHCDCEKMKPSATPGEGTLSHQQIITKAGWEYISHSAIHASTSLIIEKSVHPFTNIYLYGNDFRQRIFQPPRV